MLWRIDETATHYDSFEVEAKSREEAIALHRAGTSVALRLDNGCETELVDVTPLQREAL